LHKKPLIELEQEQGISIVYGEEREVKQDGTEGRKIDMRWQ
jgi:hypothetical protein